MTNTNIAALNNDALASLLRDHGHDATAHDGSSLDEADHVIVGAVELRWDAYSDSDNPGWLAVYGEEQVAVDTLADVERAIARGNA